MKERPILFSAPMVHAILEGRKTQTRRVVKLPHENPLGHWEPFLFGGQGCRDSKGWEISGQMTISHTRTGEVIGCPYGAPGDRLWVRETFCGNCDDSLVYRATVDEDTDWSSEEIAETRWRPSIHMPRALSRIDLEVTGVRVERLQDISEADAISEGLTEFFWDADSAARPYLASKINAGTRYWEHVIQKRRRQGSVWDKAQLAYKELWTDINGAGSWDANPWVWVVEFKRADAQRAER